MLKHLIGKQYTVQRYDSPCYSFCRYASRILGFSLPPSVWAMRCAGVSPILCSVVLFHYSDNSWHTGIVWPDCVHFIHAVKRTHQGHFVKVDRLNRQALHFVKGYYVND